MTHVTNSNLDSAPAISPFTRKRRSGATFPMLLALLALSACSASGSGTAPDTKGTADGIQERSQNPDDALGDDEGASADAAGAVTLGEPYLKGSCAGGKATSHLVADNQRYLTMLFSQQTYGGNPSDPDYWGRRSEGRLVGDAKSRAPQCELHIPMTVTAGYKFSPTDFIIRGFARRGFIFTEYRWGNAASSYTFERQVDGDFVIQEPLYNLWSPTCGSSKGSTISTELVAVLKPYTADDAADSPLIAVDSLDVAGYGSIVSCKGPENHDRVAQEGEACGIVEHDTVHPVRCDQNSQHNNICVYTLTNTETGTCVNQTKTPKPSELEVGLDDECGGPFYKYCSTKEQPLVCQFRDADARQNASSHYGKCVARLPVGSQCSTTTYGACNTYSCNSTLDPCEAGSKCSGGKCVATKTKTAAADESGNSPSDDSAQSNDVDQNEPSTESDASGWEGDSLQGDEAPPSDD